MSDRNDYDPYVSHGKSIRQIVFELMASNKDITPSQIMFLLKQSYGVELANKQTIKNYMQDWKQRNHYQARPLRPHRRTFRWFVERTVQREQVALNMGWRLAANRNRMLLFKYDYGSVHWQRTGNVYVFLRGQAMLAHAKETFSRAFLNVLSSAEINKLVEAPLRELGRHMVFDMGQPLPRFEIRYYEKSHGLRIYSDGSHPTAIEVAESEPFWLSNLEQVTAKFGEDIKAFGEDIKAHLQLVQTWQKEADARQQVLDIDRKRNQRLEENLLRIEENLQVNSKALLTLSSLLAKAKRRPRSAKKKHGLFHGFHKRFRF